MTIGLTIGLAKYMAKLSTYSFSSTNDLVNTLKNKSVSHDCDHMFFNVTSLFTNVSLEYTNDVIQCKVYEEELIETDIPKKETKGLLLLSM